MKRFIRFALIFLFCAVSALIYSKDIIDTEETLKDFANPILLKEPHPYQWTPDFFTNALDTLRFTVDLKYQDSATFRVVRLSFKTATFIDASGNPVSNFDGSIKEITKGNFKSAFLDFRFTENNKIGIFHSSGLIDLKFEKDGKPIRLKEGSYIDTLFAADECPQDLLKNTMIYSYDDSKQQWVYESRPKITNINNRVFFRFRITHFSWWNCDAPMIEHACIRGKVTIRDNMEAVPICVIAEGIDYLGTSIRYVKNNEIFEIDVKRNSKINVYAISSNNCAGVIKEYPVGNLSGTSMQTMSENYKYNLGLLELTPEKYTELKNTITNEYNQWYFQAALMRREGPNGETDYNK